MKIRIVAECTVDSNHFKRFEETDKGFLERLNDNEGQEAFNYITTLLENGLAGATCKAEIVFESLPFTCTYCKSHEPEKHQSWCPTVTGEAPDCT